MPRQKKRRPNAHTETCSPLRCRRPEQNAQLKCLPKEHPMTQVMLLTHAKWRTFTQRPLPAAGSAGHMLSLAMESRAAVDAMNEAAAANGGKADANPAEDYGLMYSRDLADLDGHLWGVFWMDAAGAATTK
jgi:predicted lactoylglutathione lyase